MVFFVFRISASTIVLASLGDVLNRIPLPDAQLSELASAIGETEAPNALHQMFIAERCMGSDLFLKGPQLVGYWAKTVPVWFRPMRYLRPIEIDHMSYLVMAERGVQASQSSPRERFKAYAELKSAAESLPTYLKSADLAHQLAEGLMRAFLEDLKSSARRDAGQVALAIERYRIAEGKLPDDLSVLAPRYLQTVPLDPFDEAPIRYRTLPEGYVVYSVGENGTDDGGEIDPSGQYGTGGDLAFKVERP
jgi:hypothetical protein